MITFGTCPDIILQYLAVGKVVSRYKVSISLKPVNICTTTLIRLSERPCFAREKFQSFKIFSLSKAVKMYNIAIQNGITH